MLVAFGRVSTDSCRPMVARNRRCGKCRGFAQALLQDVSWLGGLRSWGACSWLLQFGARNRQCGGVEGLPRLYRRTFPGQVGVEQGACGLLDLQRQEPSLAFRCFAGPHGDFVNTRFGLPELY